MFAQEVPQPLEPRGSLIAAVLTPETILQNNPIVRVHFISLGVDRGEAGSR